MKSKKSNINKVKKNKKIGRPKKAPEGNKKKRYPKVTCMFCGENMGANNIKIHIVRCIKYMKMKLNQKAL